MEGIKERGKAEIGDKTMIDTLEPAVTVLQIRYRMTGEFRVAFADAVAAGRRGMEATKDILSRKGRSSRLGSVPGYSRSGSNIRFSDSSRVPGHDKCPGRIVSGYSHT